MARSLKLSCDHIPRQTKPPPAHSRAALRLQRWCCDRQGRHLDSGLCRDPAIRLPGGCGWLSHVGCDLGQHLWPGTRADLLVTGTAGCLLHPLQRGRPSSGASSLLQRENKQALELGEPLSGPWDLGRDGASSRCRRVLRVIPGPGWRDENRAPHGWWAGGGLSRLAQGREPVRARKAPEPGFSGKQQAGCCAGGRRDPEARHHR